MTKIIDGKKIAESIIKGIDKKRTKDIKLKVILVGNNPVSLSYISQKKKYCVKAGIGFSLSVFSENIKEGDLIKKISLISKNYSGIIVQLPLPKKMNVQKIMNSIPEKKDIDILSERSLGKFYSGDFSVLPPVVESVSQIIKREKIKLNNKNVVIIGSGRLVGKPLALWFISQGSTVSVLNKLTKDIKYFTKNADIIISGTGKTRLLKSNMIKKGSIIIDAGSSVEKKILVGDVDSSVVGIASIVSMVPGGVGPITTASLINNLIKKND
jgi:methylenetetrahydrofolate dehydrogenase (NADP+) / methenyltetrahydrofolate cyclohydrolase